MSYVGGYSNCSTTPTSLDYEWHWYGADNRLRYVQRDAGTPSRTVRSGTWEEYQYDALGRRILLRERRDTLANGANMESALTQILWDGSQLLYELRNSPPSPDLVGPSIRYGSIGYIHGREIDAPLALTDGRIPVPDWRGAYQATVFGSGATADCASGQATPCMNVELPGGTLAATFRPWAGAGGGAGTFTWRGSLLLGGRSGSGLLYRRNRYYDPQTGRFTQVDPIGLAGGANLYGFASGDPVNFADPFGLQPCKGFFGCLAELAKTEWRGFVAGSDPTGQTPLGEDQGQLGFIVGKLSVGAAGAGRVVTGSTAAAGEVAGGGRAILSARTLGRMAEEGGPFHNFPASFDAAVLRGTRTVVSENYVLYTKPGSVNGVQGVFEIGGRPSASGRNFVITHRFFRPDLN